MSGLRWVASQVSRTGSQGPARLLSGLSGRHPQDMRILPRLLLLVAAAVLFGTPSALSGQSPAAAGRRADSVRAAVRAYRTAHDVEILRELTDLLAIPNRANDSVNIRRNARLLAQMLERRGLAPRLLEVPGAPPAVYGELLVPGADRTVVFYAHYDGQAVDTTQWVTHPWSPTLRDGPLPGGKVIPPPTRAGTVNGEWRIYARSASDDKSPIVAILAAIDALRAAGTAPSVNLKFFFDGEEEEGSASLDRILTANAELLRADLWIIGDGPVHQVRRPQILFGARGTFGAELTVYGPARALHSGHYGNWAPNPIAVLASLLVSMRDEDGRILIPGYADDVVPIGALERAALNAAPKLDSALRAELLLGGTEADDALLGERIMRPAMNFRGIRSGNIGDLATNSIPTEARASIDFRLVPRQTPARVIELVEAHARARGFHIVHREPTAAERTGHRKVLRIDWSDGYPAAFTPMSHPAAVAAARAADVAVGSPIIKVPLMGGSLPLNSIEEVLKTPFVVLPIVNNDNNQHAANENLRLQNLFDGIELYAGFLAALGTAWARPIP